MIPKELNLIRNFEITGKRITYVTALIAIVILTSGCLGEKSSISDNPETAYKQLLDLQKNSDFKTKYNLTIESHNSDFGPQEADVKIYSREGVKKSEAVSESAFAPPRTINYRVKNKTVVCGEEKYKDYESDSELVCDFSKDLDSSYAFLEDVNLKDVNFTEKRKIKGRECMGFEGIPNGSLGTGLSENTKAKVNLCLDIEKGFVANWSAYIYASEGSDEQLKSSIKMKLEEYSEMVGDKEIRPPKKAALKPSCSSGNLSIVVLGQYSTAELTVNGKERTLSLERLEKQKINISESLVVGKNEIEVLIGGESQSLSCEVEEKINFETEISDVDLSQYKQIDGGLENGDFSQIGEDEFISGWDKGKSETHDLVKSELDGNAVGLDSISRFREHDPPVISQTIDLTGVKAVGIDVKGVGFEASNTRLVLLIDLERKGTFIKSPKTNKVYRDLGVKLDKEYNGVHTISLKWVNDEGKYLTNTAVDNVRLYK